ncbi:MAG: DUF6311 domain-containing protein [Gammaproteobacteria bacterium]|nr:DUF6311 domain-containing protein [Gammaproteobacteria bacterium]
MIDQARSRYESTALSLGLAALLGLVMSLVVYPALFLFGEAARFHNFVFPNDALDYRLAWQALVEHGNPWPSLWTDLFNYPDGVPISLMDGLPLAATVFRPFVSWLPADFHYFGLWHVVAVTLQAVAGAVFVRAAGVRHVVPCLLAAAFALAMPIFIGRLNWAHVALSTQGLLILSLALCIHASRERPALGFVFPRATALSLVTLAIHPLLALQVVLFCLFATALAHAPALRRIGAAAIQCLLFAAMCETLGIFAADSLASDLGLGEFGFSPLGMIVGEPDALREIYAARGPGIEQDAWLGAGCVLLLLVGLAVPPRWRIPRAYYPLAGVIVLLVLIAISPWVRFGSYFFDLSFLFPDWLVDLYGIHRAAVRLAWPLVICLSLLPLVHFASAWPRSRAILILGAAFALQLFSVAPYWAHEYQDARVAVERLLPPPQILKGGSRLLVIEELNGIPTEARHLRFAMHLAVETGIPLEGGWFSRPPPKSRDRPGFEHPGDPHTRYVAAETPEANPPTRLPQVSVPVTCVRWEWLFVCRPQ